MVQYELLGPVGITDVPPTPPALFFDDPPPEDEDIDDDGTNDVIVPESPIGGVEFDVVNSLAYSVMMTPAGAQALADRRGPGAGNAFQLENEPEKTPAEFKQCGSHCWTELIPVHSTSSVGMSGGPVYWNHPEGPVVSGVMSNTIFSSTQVPLNPRHRRISPTVQNFIHFLRDLCPTAGTCQG